MADWVETGLLALASLALVVAAVSDLKSRKIPNSISLALVMVFVAYALIRLFSDTTALADIGWELAVGGIIFVTSFVMFALGILGGGDAKLIAAVSLFAGPTYAASFLLWTAIGGGLVAVGQLIAQKMQWTIHTGKVPYGIAISAAGLWLFAEIGTI